MGGIINTTTTKEKRTMNTTATATATAAASGIWEVRFRLKTVIRGRRFVRVQVPGNDKVISRAFAALQPEERVQVRTVRAVRMTEVV